MKEEQQEQEAESRSRIKEQLQGAATRSSNMEQ
jgi:hypothetical protein